MEEFRSVQSVKQLVQDIQDKKLEGRKALDALAATGQFVFHGTKEIFEEIEPRQAFNDAVPDGEPSVFAAGSNAVALAVFMALRGSGKTGFSHQGARDGLWDLRADAKAREYMRSAQASGYVHVLSKSDFEQDSQHQWRSHTKVKPVLTIPVSSRDLSEDIALIEE